MKDEKDEDSDLDPQTQADRLEERLIDFAVRIIKLSNRLPKTQAGKHMSGQILRCGTSPAPNYGEARALKVEQTSYTNLELFLRSLKHLFGTD